MEISLLTQKVFQILLDLALSKVMLRTKEIPLKWGKVSSPQLHIKGCQEAIKSCEPPSRSSSLRSIFPLRQT